MVKPRALHISNSNRQTVSSTLKLFGTQSVPHTAFDLYAHTNIIQQTKLQNEKQMDPFSNPPIRIHLASEEMPVILISHKHLQAVRTSQMDSRKLHEIFQMKIFISYTSAAVFMRLSQIVVLK